MIINYSCFTYTREVVLLSSHMVYCIHSISLYVVFPKGAIFFFPCTPKKSHQHPRTMYIIYERLWQIYVVGGMLQVLYCYIMVNLKKNETAKEQHSIVWIICSRLVYNNDIIKNYYIFIIVIRSVQLGRKNIK